MLHDTSESTVMSLPAGKRGDERNLRVGGRLQRALVHVLAVFHRWAESGWAGSAVGTWALLQGSVVPGPSDALLLPLGLSDPGRVFKLALWATLGATLGGLLAYAIGRLAFDDVGRPALGLMGVSEATLLRSRGLFERRGWAIVALSAISPLSTKAVCLAAGSFGVPPLQFVAGLLAGRATRFLAVALLVRFAGERITARIERKFGRPIEELE
jgi:membrane protein YqaA with SNARE-associated domain